MAREVLEVSPDRIKVDYVFERTAEPLNGPVDVLFPLPLYGADKPSWSWAGVPRGFNVRVDGQTLPFRTLVRARMRGKSSCPDWPPTRECTHDVTDAIRALGLSDRQMAHFPVATPFRDSAERALAVPALTAEQKTQLVRHGFADEEGPSAERPYPLWFADVAYFWKMHFDDKPRIEVSHQYAPFTSGGAGAVLSVLSEEELRTEYCADDAFVREWNRLVSLNGPLGTPQSHEAVRIAYILTTANSWAQPIGEFTLRLKKRHPSERVTLCFPGRFRKVDALTLETTLQTFTPRTELKALFFVSTSQRAADYWNAAGAAPIIAP